MVKQFIYDMVHMTDGEKFTTYWWLWLSLFVGVIIIQHLFRRGESMNTFTIKCNQCGEEMILNDHYSTEEDIGEIGINPDYGGEINLNCLKCGNSIQI